MKKSNFQILLNMALIALLVGSAINTTSAQRLNKKLNRTTTIKPQAQVAPSSLKLQAATTDTEERDLKEKCSNCKKLQEQKNTEAYNEADCRATAQLCLEVNKVGGGPVIIGGSDTMATESTSTNSRETEMMYYEQFNNVIILLDDIKKTYKNVTTTIEVFGQDKKLLYSSAKKPMQHYTFNKRNNKLISLQGSRQLKTLSPEKKNVLMVPVKLRKLKPQKALVKVTVKAMHPKTRKMVTVKTLGKKVYLK